MAFEKLYKMGFSVGIALPLNPPFDNIGQRGDQHHEASAPEKVRLNIHEHKLRVQQADRLGFSAVWMPDTTFHYQDSQNIAQIFETFSYLGYLACITTDILLGASGITLPLKQPMLVKTSAQTLARLSQHRLILGVGSLPYGPYFKGPEQALYQQAVDWLMRKHCDGMLDGKLAIPAPKAFCVYGTHTKGNDIEWQGANMDGWLAPAASCEQHSVQVAKWRCLAGNKPYACFLQLDFCNQQDTAAQRIGPVLRTGINGLIQELDALRRIGVNHVALQLVNTALPTEVIIDDLANWVLPEFQRV